LLAFSMQVALVLVTGHALASSDPVHIMGYWHALKRVAKQEEVARSVLYLASDDAAFVSGTALLVDGGASITRT
jgi:short subunit fatty acids transporter